MSRAELNESATIMADEFGSVGTYTPVVGTPVTVAPVMTYGFQLIDDFGAYELRDRANIDMAEYPGEPEQGDSLVVGDDSYTVDTWEQVGSMWHITLRIGVAPAPPVDTTPPYITTIQVNDGLGIATSRTVSVDVLIAADDMSSVLNMMYLVNTVPGTPPSTMDPGWLSYANRLTAVTVPADGNYTFTGYAKDEAGNVSIGQEFAQQAVFIDSIAPQVVSGQVDVTGLVLTLGMSEAVTGNLGFSMTADGLDVALSNPTAPDASTIQFDVAQVGPGQVLLLSYAAGDVIDQVGNPLADFTGQSVTNNSEADLIAPEVVSAQVDVTGLVLTLGMSEAVTGNVGFSMTADGLAVALSNPTAPDASTIQFDVEQVYQGQVLLLSYTAGDVADQASNPLADFSGQSVTNNSDVSGVPVPVLSAFTYDPDTFEIQDKAIGVGAVATSRVAVINVPDDQLVYKQVPTGTIAYHGARYVGDVAYADDGTGTLLDPEPYAAVAPEATNYFLNSQAPVTQDVAGRTGDHTVSVIGAGTVTLSGGMAGVASEGSPVTGDPGGVTVTCTVAGGPPANVQFEDNATATYPIYTTTVPVTRDKDTITVDSANLANAEGSLYFDLIPGGDTSALFGAFLEMDNGFACLDDGVHTNAAAALVDTNAASQIGMVWSSAGMQINVNGTWSQLVPHDGDLLSGALGVLTDAATVGRIKGLKIWDAADKALIESFMPVAQDWGDSLVLAAKTTSANEDVVVTNPSLVGYNATVDWGDGTTPDVITAWNQAELTHTYAEKGNHVIQIDGVWPGLALGSSLTLNSFTAIINGGNTLFDSPDIRLADKCGQIVVAELDRMLTPNVSGITYSFRKCVKMRSVTFIGCDLSGVASTRYSFDGCDLLTYIDDGFAPLSANANMFGTFIRSSRIKRLPGSLWDMPLCTDMASAFQFNAALVDLDGAFFATMSALSSTASTFIGCDSLSQQSLDSIVAAIYSNRMNYTWATPEIDLSPPTATLSGIYQDATPPTTGQEFRYKLENDPDGEGFNTWTITV